MVTRKRTRLSSKGAPSSITVRMYNVGFGDCFLITFHYTGRDRHMLIDYGSTAAPQNTRDEYMLDVAKDIKSTCNGKLDILVVTHRHRDHISGFATDGHATGKIIASLQPDYVVQPWTEDPHAKPTAMTATSVSYTKGAPDRKQLTSHFLGALEDMHLIAAAAANSAERGVFGANTEAGRQIAFLGKDNLKNASAVKNLMAMGRKGKAYYVNAGMKLNSLLPGVKITVLGPPTLEQSESIRKERDKDPNEFWQFRGFWASQSSATSSTVVSGRRPVLPGLKGVSAGADSPVVRWFVEQSRKMHADQMLELVRDLDSVMNNTSVILLMEIGDRKLLFPGDAQIENWSYALKNQDWRKLLETVIVYKVGHHGSLNATPKSLWKLFRQRGGDHRRDRLTCLCSTKSHKHGSTRSGTEVPRRLLLEELERESAFTSTEHYRAPEKLVQKFPISVANNSLRTMLPKRMGHAHHWRNNKSRSVQKIRVHCAP